MEKGLLIVIAVFALIALLGHLKQQRATGGKLWPLRGDDEDAGGDQISRRIAPDDDDLAAMLATLEKMERRLSVVERLADLPEAPPLSPRRPPLAGDMDDDHGTPLSLRKARAERLRTDQSPR